MNADEAPMRRTGTRTELVQELMRLAEGWDHLAKPRMRDASMAGIDRLRLGASSVRVGHTRYEVTES